MKSTQPICIYKHVFLLRRLVAWGGATLKVENKKLCCLTADFGMFFAKNSIEKMAQRSYDLLSCNDEMKHCYAAFPCHGTCHCPAIHIGTIHWSLGWLRCWTKHTWIQPCTRSCNPTCLPTRRLQFASLLRNGKKMDGSLRKQEIHFQPCMEPLATKHEGFLPTKEWSRMEQSRASFLAPDLCWMIC